MLSRRNFLGLTTSGLGLLLSPGASLTRWWDRGVPLERVRRQSLVMGSVASFDVLAPTERDAYDAINRAVEVFRRLDRSLSMYRDDSETAQLETAAGRAPVSISPDTRTVLEKAQAVARKTDGRFDVTIEPLMRQWGFRKAPSAAISHPTDARLRRLRGRIGYRKLEIGDDWARLEKSGMALDLGGIAGGFALDRSIEVLRSANVAAALINFSGDIHCFGTPARDRPWTVHLVDPATMTPQEKDIPLHDEALSTSGSYQNRRHSPDGRSWGHLLRPELARPVEPTGSVTALHPSACTADAWSTACYLGADVTPPALRIIRLSAEA